MNNIIISIQPKWCELIASGKKTIEVRKTAPQAPFRAFIYCTKDKCGKIGKPFPHYEHIGIWNKNFSPPSFVGYGGKIIGEFVCENVTKYEDIDLSHFEFAREANGVDKYPIEENSCLTLKQMHEYGKGKDLYFLHITALKIYEKPKELGEFHRFCGNDGEGCPDADCPYYEEPSYEYGEITYDCYSMRPITRPPQSWQYVENSND